MAPISALDAEVRQDGHPSKNVARDGVTASGSRKRLCCFAWRRSSRLLLSCLQFVEESSQIGRSSQSDGVAVERPLPCGPIHQTDLFVLAKFLSFAHVSSFLTGDVE